MEVSRLVCFVGDQEGSNDCGANRTRVLNSILAVVEPCLLASERQARREPI